jgi:hypothetical protein
MADDADVFMQGISNLGTLIGLGSSLKDIFGSSPPTVADIAAAVAHDAVSSNYVLHCNSPSRPSGMQDNWCWCNKCSGLHLNQGARPCPAGGTHNPAGSGNCVLAYGAVPDASNLGINSTQTNWLWCSKCAGLHYQWGNRVCPAGGAHDATGSANYWLANIGLIPQP